MSDTFIFFFGCWKEPGHYFWLPGMTKATTSEVWSQLGQYCYQIDRVPKVFGVEYGEYHFPVDKGTWTYIAVSDNTVDTRPGSHATFVISGQMSKTEAIDYSYLKFPEVTSRINLIERAKIL